MSRHFVSRQVLFGLLVLSHPFRNHCQRSNQDTPTSQSKAGVTVDLDRIVKKGIKDALAQREKEFIEVTEETGGSVALPSFANDLIDQAGEVARRIDSQYVISYKPTRPLNSATENDYRKIEVIPRRVGLRVIVRRGYVARVPG